MLPIIAQFRQKQMVNNACDMSEVFAELFSQTFHYLNGYRDALIQKGNRDYESIYENELNRTRRDLCEEILPSFGMYYGMDPWRAEMLQVIVRKQIKEGNAVVDCATTLLSVDQEEWEAAIATLGEIACARPASESAAWAQVLKNLSHEAGTGRFMVSSIGTILFRKECEHNLALSA